MRCVSPFNESMSGEPAYTNLDSRRSQEVMKYGDKQQRPRGRRGRLHRGRNHQYHNSTGIRDDDEEEEDDDDSNEDDDHNNHTTSASVPESPFHPQQLHRDRDSTNLDDDDDDEDDESSHGPATTRQQENSLRIVSPDSSSLLEKSSFREGNHSYSQSDFFPHNNSQEKETPTKSIKATVTKTSPPSMSSPRNTSGSSGSASATGPPPTKSTSKSTTAMQYPHHNYINTVSVSSTSSSSLTSRATTPTVNNTSAALLWHHNQSKSNNNSNNSTPSKQNSNNSTPYKQKPHNKSMSTTTGNDNDNGNDNSTSWTMSILSPILDGLANISSATDNNNQNATNVSKTSFNDTTNTTRTFQSSLMDTMHLMSSDDDNDDDEEQQQGSSNSPNTGSIRSTHDHISSSSDDDERESNSGRNNRGIRPRKTSRKSKTTAARVYAARSSQQQQQQQQEQRQHQDKEQPPTFSSTVRVRQFPYDANYNKYKRDQEESSSSKTPDYYLAAYWNSRLGRREVYSRRYRPIAVEAEEMNNLEQWLGIPEARQLRNKTILVQQWMQLHPSQALAAAQGSPMSIVLKRGPVSWGAHADCELILLTRGFVVARKIFQYMPRFQLGEVWSNVEHVATTGMNSFQIVCGDMKRLEFQCETASEQKAWMDALRIVILQAYTHSAAFQDQQRNNSGASRGGNNDSPMSFQEGWQYKIIQTPWFSEAVTGKVRLNSNMLDQMDNTTLNRLDSYNQSAPLHYATRANNVDAIRFLLQAGADPNLTDGVGRSPVDYAREDNLPQSTVDLLESYGGKGPNAANQRACGVTPVKSTSPRCKRWTIALLLLLVVGTGVATFTVIHLGKDKADSTTSMQSSEAAETVTESTSPPGNEDVSSDASATPPPFLVVGVNPIPATNLSTISPQPTFSSNTISTTRPTASPTASPTAFPVTDTAGITSNGDANEALMLNQTLPPSQLLSSDQSRPTNQTGPAEQPEPTGTEQPRATGSPDTTNQPPPPGDLIFGGSNQTNDQTANLPFTDDVEKLTVAPSMPSVTPARPTVITFFPTIAVTEAQTSFQSQSPTFATTEESTTFAPTLSPTTSPASFPTSSPTEESTTMAPTWAATRDPFAPTNYPTFATISREYDLLPEDVLLFEFLVEHSLDEGAGLRNPQSPQYKAFRWLSGNMYLSDYSDERKIQRYVLAALFYSTKGDQWINNQYWLSDEDECTVWFSRVAEVPSDSICNMDNQMLTLDLDYNNLQGNLPIEIGLLKHLRRAELYGGPQGFLAGTLPSQIGLLTALQSLSVRGNEMTGTIPSELGKCSSLDNLNLSKNRFVGSISSQMGMLLKLTNMSMENNRFTGSIISEIGQIKGMQSITMGTNTLSGRIPTEIGLLTALRGLTLELNQFDGATIPSEIGLLSDLSLLHLSVCKLVGPIPSEIGRAQALQSLQLRGNALTSSIPSEIGMLTNLQGALDASFNEMTGTIPSELGQASWLRSLYLNSNQLSGGVPESISKLSRLNTLRIDQNNLSGAVPIDACEIFFVTYPLFYADCMEVQCTCCTYCCIDGAGCACEHAGTVNEFLC